MKTNTAAKREKIFTHEGARAVNINAEQQLRRSVMACMLFEGTFYESGEDIATRIASLIAKVPAEKVRDIAIEAREQMKLRHVPLLLTATMAGLKTHSHVVAETAERVIQRPDELAEILAIYSRGRAATKKLSKLSKQLKLGIAKAFQKFDEYSLAKYNRDAEIKLRDVLFLVHAKPKNKTQEKLWGRLIDGTLKTPDTWEVELSAGKGEDKKASWERLLKEDKLGALALLRNLRNFKDEGVDQKLVRKALAEIKTERVLPFRFISAAKYAPQWEPEIETAMFKCLEGHKKLTGKTAVVIDNSGSMESQVSGKSEISRIDAAAALAILVREICKDVAVIVFSDEAKLIPARRGFALRDAIKQSMKPAGTQTDKALALAQQEGYDRIIVITDEQSHPSDSMYGGRAIRNPSYNGKEKLGYFINVACYQNGVGYGPWQHIDGWSEAVLDYIQAFEDND